MKSSCFNKIAGATLLLFITACNAGDPGDHNVNVHSTDPVDSSVVRLARASGAQVRSDLPTIEAMSGTRIFSLSLPGVVSYDTRRKKVIASRVSGRIERLLVDYNYEKVTKGQKLMELYSPDLAAAQRELIFLDGTGDRSMLQKAQQRLRLLGMSDSDITQVQKTKQILYSVPVYSNTSGYIVEQSTPVSNSSPVLPAPGQGMNEMDAEPAAQSSSTQKSIPFQRRELTVREGQYVNAGTPLFTVYESETLVANFSVSQQIAGRLVQGQKLLLYPQHDPSAISTGHIALIEPVYRNNQQFNSVRVYVPGKNFQAGELLTARVPVIFSGGWWLPQQAVWTSGSTNIVFRKDGEFFKPVDVIVSASINGSVLTTTDISDWKVAATAAYLADSEGFIHTNTKTNNYEE